MINCSNEVSWGEDHGFITRESSMHVMPERTEGVEFFDGIKVTSSKGRSNEIHLVYHAGMQP